MSDYSKTTNFTAKDSLPTGNPSKLIKGSEFDTEFDALETSVGTKANKVGSPVTGDLILQAADGDLSAAGWGFPNVNADVTATDEELNYNDGATPGTTVTTGDADTEYQQVKAAVTGFTKSQTFYIDDEGDSQGSNTFNALAVIGASWESIGPTGSSATNIWTALDALPSTTKWVEVKVYAGASSFISIYSRKTGSSASAVTSTNVAYSTSLDITTFKIAVDANIRFDLYINASGGTGCTLSLVGFGV